MKKSIFIGILFLGIGILFFTNQQVSSKQVIVEQVPLNEQKIELYIEEEVNTAPYEPETGVYIGAYVEKNVDLDNDMKKFEQALGQKQAFRVFQYSDSSRIRTSDILECIANRQVPYIKIMMDESYDINQVYRMVGDVKSNYSTPIFIELFPVTNQIGNSVTYKEHYEEAYKIIKKYIKNSVVVWSSNLEQVKESIIYYPGNHLVDWVGLNIYLPQYKDGIAYNPEIKLDVDFWYKNFQDKKPLMISSLAVSYFSRYDHTYAVEDAKKKLGVFYDDLIQSYPRIKGILYIDVDMKEVSKVGIDDYRISAHSQITSYMSEVLSDGIFLHEVEPESFLTNKEYLKYTVPVVESRGKLYISENYAKALFHHIKLKNISAIQDLENEKYYSLSELLKTTNGYYIK
ncbi:MAG: hypothetical protein ACRC1P_12065 [Cellulosilyticaceae bacterium]